MSNLATHDDITQHDLSRGRNLRIAAFSTPFILGGVPAVLFLALTFIFGVTPPVAATIFFLGLILTIAGFVTGLALSGYFLYRHSNWSYEMRERIAARGVR